MGSRARKRLEQHERTLVIDNGAITKAFYPVFPPDKNAEEVIAWLRASRA